MNSVGADPVAARIAGDFAVRSVQQRARAFGFADADEIEHAGARRRADERAESGVFVSPVAGLHFFHLRRDRGQAFFALAHKHRDADGHATLPGRAARRARKRRRGFGAVGVGHNDEMVLAPASACTRLKFAAAVLYMCCPTATEPTKDTARISGWARI